MHEKSAIQGRIGLAVGVAAVLVVLGTAIGASVFPVRLDDAPAEAPPVTDNPFRVEPYQQRLEANGVLAVEVVAVGVVIDLCGDGDGCQVRLIRTVPNAPQSSLYAGGHLLTDSTAGTWFFYEAASGVATRSGSRLNGSDELVVELTSISGKECRFRDDGVFNRYELDADPGVAGLVTCLLRIDD